jgi:hypothetical protein
MARHLPDSCDSAEDRAGSRAREASRAAAGGPGRGPARRPRRRALRAASRPGRPRPRAWRGACARSAGASPRDTPSSPAPSARAPMPGTTVAIVLAAGVARPWSTRRPVSVYGPSPPYDAFGAAPTRCAAGPLAAPEGGVGAPSRHRREGHSGYASGQARLACERPRCGAARRPPSAAGTRRAGDSRGVTARGGGPRRRDP